MSPDSTDLQNEWVLAFDRVRAYLQAETKPGSDEGEVSGPAPLEQIGAALGLSSFEKDVVTLCMGMELDEGMAVACAGEKRDRPPYPTVGLALSKLPRSHWSAISPDRPLRSWRLVELCEGPTLTSTRLRLDERIVHHLLGLQPMDQRLVPYLTPTAGNHWIPRSMARLAEGIQSSLREGLPAIIQMDAADPRDAICLASTVCEELQLTLWRTVAEHLPVGRSERDTFIRLWQREELLAQRALLIMANDAHPGRVPVTDLVESSRHIFLVSPHGLPAVNRSVQRIRIEKPNPREQTEAWRRLLGGHDRRLNGGLEELSGQFSLGLTNLAQAAEAAQRQLRVGRPLRQALWQACRSTAAPRMSSLAQQIESLASWDDLILPERERGILRTIAAQVKHQHAVYEGWGFAGKSNRGLGISALFFGESGTGKTMAAEVLARELDLLLYRIDLSAVVNKYIGETEKNLRAVFDAAEDGGAILLFDEADALFGKRSEVRDSHDRHANIEVSYLLQRMENYRGLAILTSNMKSSLDRAFVRRIRFMVGFPFPAVPQRVCIWKSMFPGATETAGLNYERLAQLNVAGGAIRNIALNAAFLAMDEHQPVGMQHVYGAAQVEYAKLEKPLTTTETRGWL